MRRTNSKQARDFAKVGPLGAACSNAKPKLAKQKSCEPKGMPTFFKRTVDQSDCSRNSGEPASKKPNVVCEVQQGGDGPPSGIQAVQEPRIPAQPGPGNRIGSKRNAADWETSIPKNARRHSSDAHPQGVRGTKRKATYDHSQPQRSVANILATNPRLAARLGRNQTARPPEPE